MNSQHKPHVATTLRSAASLLLCLSVAFCSALAQNQAAEENQTPPASTLTSKTTHAVGYQVGTGATKVDLTGTDLMPNASGEAKVEIKSKAGRANVQIKVRGMQPASKLGTEFLTYVLWVVTPEGRTGNTGELLINKDGNGELSATTPAQTFSLIVTAEPYSVVRVPSEMVVLQNEIRKNTTGKVFAISEYKLMRRGQYEKMGNPLAMTPDLERVPLQMYEARNAVEIAKSRGAERYAADVFSKADASLKASEQALANKAEKNKIISVALQTAQFAEDARALAVLRQEQERIQREKDEAAAKAKAEAEAKAAEEAAEAKRKTDAEMSAAKQKADAEIAAKEQQRLAAEREKQLLRAKLLEQFNRVLPTSDTERGLVVNMGDVLFDTGKADLRAEAREALARLSGIVLNYPALHLAIEGHTDATGSDELNQTLSEKRAGAVRDYLISHGLTADALTAQGFGKKMPVADNSTAQGRQKNRRVEIVVSGEVIGNQIGSGK